MFSFEVIQLILLCILSLCMCVHSIFAAENFRCALSRQHGDGGQKARLYLKDRFNYEYLILRFGYPSHFAGTNNCGIAKYQPHPLIIQLIFFNNSIVV